MPRRAGLVDGCSRGPGTAARVRRRHLARPGPPPPNAPHMHGSMSGTQALDGARQSALVLTPGPPAPPHPTHPPTHPSFSQRAASFVEDLSMACKVTAAAAGVTAEQLSLDVARLEGALEAMHSLAKALTGWVATSFSYLLLPRFSSLPRAPPPCPGSSSLSPFSVSVSPPVFSAPALASCSPGLPASPPNAVHSCCGARLCPGIHLSLAGYAPPGWAGRPAAQRQLRLATSGHAQPRTQHASTLSLPPLLRCAGCCAWSAAVRPS